MWKCPKCGESLKDAFEVCWSCGTTKEGVLDPHFLDPEAVSSAPENEPLEEIADDVDEEREPMVTVAQCNLAAEAHAMRVQLEAAGIPVFLADELTVAMDWLLSNAIGGVKVQVPERYVERAAHLLEGFSRSIEEKEAEESESAEEGEARED
jgi:hypothetical protein